MLRGASYDAADPALLAERLEARVRCERLNGLSFAENGQRHAILRELLGSFGDRAEVMSPFECDYGWQITIGARTFINYGCVILDAARVAIGDDVQIGPNVQLLTALHPLEPVERRLATETTAPVTIGSGAWLA